jgi:hypothetical protein
LQLYILNLRLHMYIELLHMLVTRGQCYRHVFGDLSKFSAKKIGVSLESQYYGHFLHNQADF